MGLNIPIVIFSRSTLSTIVFDTKQRGKDSEHQRDMEHQHFILLEGFRRREHTRLYGPGGSQCYRPGHFLTGWSRVAPKSHLTPPPGAAYTTCSSFIQPVGNLTEHETNTSMDSNNTKVFPLFSHLPIKIQNQIWRANLPLRVIYYDKLGSTTYPTSPLATTCHNSRQEFFKIYPDTIEWGRSPFSSRKRDNFIFHFNAAREPFCYQHNLFDSHSIYDLKDVEILLLPTWFFQPHLFELVPKLKEVWISRVHNRSGLYNYDQFINIGDEILEVRNDQSTSSHFQGEEVGGEEVGGEEVGGEEVGGEEVGGEEVGGEEVGGEEVGGELASRGFPGFQISEDTITRGLGKDLTSIDGQFWARWQFTAPAIWHIYVPENRHPGPEIWRYTSPIMWEYNAPSYWTDFQIEPRHPSPDHLHFKLKFDPLLLVNEYDGAQQRILEQLREACAESQISFRGCKALTIRDYPEMLCQSVETEYVRATDTMSLVIR